MLPLHKDFSLGIRAANHGSYFSLYAERIDRLMIERIAHGAQDLDHLDPWQRGMSQARSGLTYSDPFLFI